MTVITKEAIFTNQKVGCQIHRRYLYEVIQGQIGEILEEGIEKFETSRQKYTPKNFGGKICSNWHTQQIEKLLRLYLFNQPIINNLYHRKWLNLHLFKQDG